MSCLNNERKNAITSTAIIIIIIIIIIINASKTDMTDRNQAGK